MVASTQRRFVLAPISVSLNLLFFSLQGFFLRLFVSFNKGLELSQLVLVEQRFQELILLRVSFKLMLCHFQLFSIVFFLFYDPVDVIKEVNGL